MTEIADEHSLEAWLKDKPQEYACVLAARTALRVAPLLAEALREEEAPRRGAIVLPSFRALASANFVSAWPERAPEILRPARTVVREASDTLSETSRANQLVIVEYREISEELPLGFIEDLEADDRAFDVAAHAVRAALHAVQAAIDAVDAANGIASLGAASEAALEAVVTAYSGVDGVHGYTEFLAAVEEDADVAPHFSEFWKAIERDAELLEIGTGQSGGSAGLGADLPKRALWLDSMPVWVGRKWADLKDGLPDDEEWRVWTDWYESRLAGQPANEAQEFDRLTIPEEDWKRGPAYANTVIKRRLEAQPDPLIVAITHSFEELDAVKENIDLKRHTNRIRKALPDDPSHAVGATKEILEATMKTILHRCGVQKTSTLSYKQLTARCLSELRRTGTSPPATKGEKTPANNCY